MDEWAKLQPPPPQIPSAQTATLSAQSGGVGGVAGGGLKERKGLQGGLSIAIPQNKGTTIQPITALPSVTGSGESLADLCVGLQARRRLLGARGVRRRACSGWHLPLHADEPAVRARPAVGAGDAPGRGGWCAPGGDPRRGRRGTQRCGGARSGRGGGSRAAQRPAVRQRRGLCG